MFSVSCGLVSTWELLTDNANKRQHPKMWQTEKLQRVSPTCGSCNNLQLFSDVPVVSWGNKTAAVNPLPEGTQSIVTQEGCKINVRLVSKRFSCCSMSVHSTVGNIFNWICWVKVNKICWPWALENDRVVLEKIRRLESYGTCFIEARKSANFLSLHLHTYYFCLPQLSWWVREQLLWKWCMRILRACVKVACLPIFKPV